MSVYHYKEHGVALRVLEKIKLTNTGKVTNLQECLHLSGVEDFEMDDCSQVTTTASFIYAAPGVITRKDLF